MLQPAFLLPFTPLAIRHNPIVPPGVRVDVVDEGLERGERHEAKLAGHEGADGVEEATDLNGNEMRDATALIPLTCPIDSPFLSGISCCHSFLSSTKMSATSGSHRYERNNKRMRYIGVFLPRLTFSSTDLADAHCSNTLLCISLGLGGSGGPEPLPPPDDPS